MSDEHEERPTRVSLDGVDVTEWATSVRTPASPLTYGDVTEVYERYRAVAQVPGFVWLDGRDPTLWSDEEWEQRVRRSHEALPTGGHVCGERCSCPKHGVRLWYHEGEDPSHACPVADCRYAFGIEVP